MVDFDDGPGIMRSIPAVLPQHPWLPVVGWCHYLYSTWPATKHSIHQHPSQPPPPKHITGRNIMNLVHHHQSWECSCSLASPLVGIFEMLWFWCGHSHLKNIYFHYLYLLHSISHPSPDLLWCLQYIITVHHPLPKTT